MRRIPAKSQAQFLPHKLLVDFISMRYVDAGMRVLPLISMLALLQQTNSTARAESVPTAGRKQSTPLPEPLDMLCLCRRFQSPKLHLKVTDAACTSSASRWKPLQIENPAYTAIGTDGEIGTPGGLHAVIATHGKTAAIAIRHQEGEGIFDDELWEAMSMWGRAALDLSVPSVFTPCSMSSSAASALQRAIYNARLSRQYSYVYQLQQLIDAVVTQLGPEYTVVFTGYSLGGAYAQIAALQHSAPAVVFASLGIQDILLNFCPELVNSVATAKIVNYVDNRDDVPKMDCQVAKVCQLKQAADTKELTAEQVHLGFVYGSQGIVTALTAKGYDKSLIECIDGKTWSKTHGHCEGDTCRKVNKVIQTAADNKDL
jgi:dienelactone hydrolase